MRGIQSDLYLYRIFFGVGSVIYPAWVIPFLHFVPTAKEDVPGRLGIGAFFLISFIASYGKKITKLKLELYFLTAVCAATSHAIYLAYLNNLTPPHAVGIFVTIASITICLNSVLYLTIYSALVLTLPGILIYKVESGFPLGVFYVGIAIELLLGYIAQIARTQIVAKLRQAEEKLREGQEIARMANWESDLMRKQTYWSDGMYTLLRLPLSTDPSIDTFVGCLHPDDRAAFKAQFEAENPEKQRYQADWRILFPSGETRYLQTWNQITVGHNQRVIRIKSVMLDVTEIRLAEELAAQSMTQIAENSKMAALGQMAGGVAHEINNPLAIIKLQAAQLKEMFQKETIDHQVAQKRLAGIETTTDRIAKIVAGLRNFSRDGSHDPYEIVNVRQLIDETLSFCNERFNNEGIRVAIDDSPRNLSFKGQSIQMSQVILNLLNNAHDAIETLPDKWIRVSVVESQTDLEIRVTDSGAGVPAEIREKLFQPFFTTKTLGKGMGMGLSISIGIVGSHQGRLYIDTESPNTCFVVSLPKAS